MSFREFLLLYKYTWISFAAFFVLSAISMALDNIIPQFFAFMFIFSTVLSFFSIFIVNAVILTKFRKNKRYLKFYKKIYPENNSSHSKHESSTEGSRGSEQPSGSDYLTDPIYSSMQGNIHHREY